MSKTKDLTFFSNTNICNIDNESCDPNSFLCRFNPKDEEKEKETNNPNKKCSHFQKEVK